MSDTSKPTRIQCHAWAKNYYAGKFVEWIRVGKGYIEIGKDGKPRAYFRSQSTARGDSVNTVLLPIGEIPPPPELAPKRPDDTGEDEAET